MEKRCHVGVNEHVAMLGLMNTLSLINNVYNSVNFDYFYLFSNVIFHLDQLLRASL